MNGGDHQSKLITAKPRTDKRAAVAESRGEMCGRD